jgi:hypothetical protein
MDRRHRGRASSALFAAARDGGASASGAKARDAAMFMKAEVDLADDTLPTPHAARAT